MGKFLVIPFVAAIACGSQSFKDQSREALPSKDTVAMGSPSGSSGGTSYGGDQITQNSTAGQHSPFFDLTVGVAATFNLSAAGILGVVEAVTQNEPTSCTTDSCTWGPGSGPLDYNNFKLVVTKNGDGFDWALSGQAKTRPTSDFVTFLSGHAVPGPQPHHGTGNFTVDFDASNTLDGPHDSTGKLVVSHYTNVGPAGLDVTYTGAKDSQHAGQFVNIVYSYANNTSGGGDLQFAVHNTTSGDNFNVHSRWKNDGQGRADVAGHGGGVDVQLSECWGVAPFLVSYFNSSITLNVPPFGGPVSGIESACVFTPAAFTDKTAP